MNIAVEWPCLNGYRLLQQAYAGSKTVVYRALREADQQPVAIKFLQPEMVNLSDLLHLRNHYTITQALHLPHVIHTYDLEPYGHSYALVMEDFDGPSLRDYAQGHPLALDTVLSIAISLADILHSLYQHRIVHQDIQPANILIHPNTHQIKLTDFSFASYFTQAHPTLTPPQTLEGSLAYLAPEQTGRMNRGIDYRTDFYALGVTLFELLTGRLPFLSTDPMELVHCHIAQPPPQLQEFNIQHSHRAGQASTPFLTPQPIADIVLKLMAKNAEDRYQSALGLKHDLTHCLTQWQATGTINFFVLGQRDKCDRFTLPNKLYDRDSAIATLLATFERVSGRLPLNASLTPPLAPSTSRLSCPSPQNRSPRSELILVAGSAGVGKTTLVQELCQPRAHRGQSPKQQRGYFIQGKFDQLQRNIPFSAFVQAFCSLVSQILSASSEQLHQWKTEILQAMGESGAVLIDVIPELEQVVGPQPAVPELAGAAAQNRFNRLFQRFVQVFATPHHPLVIFLDDLQWADSASLTLLHLLVSEGQNSHLLLIGAYRDQDISPTHALTLTLATLHQAEVPIQTITLLPLALDALHQMVTDTLGCSREVAAPLTEMVYQKTQGNPFFAIQFLKFLYQEGLIYFDSEIGNWQCNMPAIRTAALTEDVVALMTQQLQTLPVHTQRMLQLAACLGNLFTVETLALIAEQSAQDIVAKLQHPLQRGMIIPHGMKPIDLGEVSTSDNPGVIEPSTDNITYQFLHDRIQQAAYALIPFEERPAIHRKIGHLLLRHHRTTDPDSPVFEIVSHLNAGSSQVVDIQERVDLAHLNLQAGQRAKASTAFNTALDYLRVGLTLIPPNSWQTHYGLTLALHQELAEAAYLAGDFEAMDRWIEAVLQQASSLLDQVKVYEVKIQAHMARNQMGEALQLGLQVLSELGMSLPEEPSPTDIMAAMQQAEAALAGKSVTELLNLPTMTDPVQLATARIHASLSATAYLITPHLSPLLVIQQVLRSVQYGNTAVTASTYASYGALLNSLTNDIGRSYALGQLSLRQLARFNAKALQAQTYFIFYVLVHHWQAPLADTLAPLLEAYQVGLETGDLEFAAYSLDHYLANAYFLGKALNPLAVEVAVFRVAMQDLHQESPYNYSGFYHQAILNLLGQSSDPSLLVGHACDEKVALSLCQQRGESTGLFFLYLHKLILCYLFGHHHQALDVARCAEPYITNVPGAVVLVLHNFYASLAYLAVYEDCDSYRDPHGNCLTPSIIQQAVAHNQAKLEFWAKHAPMNYQHKYELVEAERYRAWGDRLMAMEWYDRAITTAKLAGFIQDEALANELAAYFYLAWGKANVAQLYLTEAYQAYTQWGAKAKTDALAQRYPHLLLQVLSPPTGAEQAADLSRLAGHGLDFEAILEATQSISEEIVLDQLLTKVMQVVLKTAGATKGVLLLLRQDQWERAALAQSLTQPIKLMMLPHPQMDELWPQTLVNHVYHSQTALILDHPHSQVLFAQDGYWQIQAPAAVLGLPVVKQGILMGVLYLENQLTVGAFTRDRISVLHLVCTQAAISLENARLYQQARSYARQLETSLKALSASESRLKTLSDNIPGVILRIHVKAEDSSESIPYISSGCYDLYEVTAETIMAGYRPLRSFEHPDDQAKVTASIQHSATHLTPFREEFRIITPSGQLKWIQCTAQPKQLKNGDIIWDGLLFDISDRKSAAEQLQRQAEQLAQANQQLENYSHTLEARVNERTQELSQALAHLQATQQDLIHSEKMAALGQLTASIGHEINTPLGVIRGAASNIVAAFMASLKQLPTLLHQLSPEQQSAFIALIENALHTHHSFSTKEERQLRRQIQATLVQQSIPQAETIATQLTLLRCGTDLTPYQALICDRTCPTILQAAYNLVQQYHSTQSIQQEVDRAAKIVFALKTYSHQHQADGLESINITDSLEVALTLYQNRFKQGITVNRQYAADLPKLLGHPDELTQVWINLIDNAVYAMGSEGTLEIIVTPSANHIQIAITDSGGGIPPTLQTQIFQPFFTTKPRGEGSGLGLDIVHQIIQNHQGQIQVHSQAPHTTFTICLPLPHLASPPQPSSHTP